jgi:hypothetical protein
VGDFAVGTDAGYGGLAFDSNGTLWATIGADDDSFGDETGTTASSLTQVSPSNGQLVGASVPIQNQIGQSLGIIDLAISSDGTIYGLGFNSSDFNSQNPTLSCEYCLYTIATDGEATLVGAPSFNNNNIFLDTLAFAPDGTLFATGTTTTTQKLVELFTINTSSAIATTRETVFGDVSLEPSNPEFFQCVPNSIPQQCGFVFTVAGLAVRNDGTIFGTLTAGYDGIVYRDTTNTDPIWRVLGQTGFTGDNPYADLAFAPEVIPTPVPASVWLFGSGLAALVGLRRRRA